MFIAGASEGQVVGDVAAPRFGYAPPGGALAHCTAQALLIKVRKPSMINCREGAWFYFDIFKYRDPIQTLSLLRLSALVMLPLT